MGGRGRRGAGLVVALLAATASGGVRHGAPEPDALDPFERGRYAVRTFRDTEGLPHNTVHALALDSNGFLWVGTQDGAAFFDGRLWHTVHPPSRLQSNFIRTLVATDDGSVWLGTQAAGLSRLQRGSWTTFTRELPGQRVNALAASRTRDGAPVLWVATMGGGIARWQEGQWRVYDTGSGLPANDVWALLATTDEDGTPLVWAGTERGLALLRDGAAGFVAVRDGPTTSVNSFLEVSEPSGERVLWVGTYGSGVFLRRGGGWQRLDRRSGLPSDHVTSLATDREEAGRGIVWIGTDGGGIARVRDGRVEVLDTARGLPTNAVYALLATSAAEGTSGLWVGTRNGGLALVKEGLWRQFSPSQERPDLPVTALLESQDAAGRPVLWLGTDGAGLACLADGTWHFSSTATGELPDDTVQCLLETDDGGGRSLWVGTRHGGVGRLAAGRWRWFDSRTGALPNDMVQALFSTQDRDGARSLWVGTRGGLARLRLGRWEHFGTADGLPSGSILSFAARAGSAPADAFWIGTSRGVARWTGTGFESLDALPLRNRTVQSLLETKGPGGQTELWIGTDGGGLACLAGDGTAGHLLALTDESEPPLPNNTVYALVQDTAGRIYASTNSGVARVHRAAAPAEPPRLAITTFTVFDGLPRNQGIRGAAMRDGKGRVWVGTVGGAAAFDPARERLDTTPKRLSLTATVDSNRPGQLQPHSSLSYRSRNVTFTFALVSFFRERETRYRTQLLGFEGQPSGWTDQATRQYLALPAGMYVFRVWGKDYAGNVTGPEEFPFEIRAAPWRTWWFSLLLLAVLAGSAWATVVARERVHQRRERALAALVDARTRQLSEANEILTELSYLDPLTGVANRRRFEERLDHEWRRAVRSGSLLSLIMVDIDWFKAFNDTYGHQRGDECLRLVAQTLADHLPRVGDSVARYGGEEFAVILPATDRPGAVRVAEHLRRTVEALALENAGAGSGHVVTISCGVGTIRPTLDREPAKLVHLADVALYRAKQAGRNTTRAEEAESLSSASLGLS